MKRSGIGSRKGPPHLRPPVTIVCKVCGTERTYRPTGGMLVKTCSPGCARELKRRGDLDRRGTANPNFRHGRRAGARDREGERRWYATVGRACAVCGGPGGVKGLVLHHVVYRQHLRAQGGDEWDGRNGLTLCNSCHMSHHRHGRVLSLRILPDDALAYALETLGTGPAYEYLRRYYGGDDPRVEALIA